MDPVGNVPLYVSLLKDLDAKRQRLVIVRELVIALVVIILFNFLGGYLLKLLHITNSTLMIAGGIILFIIAIRMIFPRGKEGYTESPEQGEPFIVPLAIPLVAGPSVLAAVMIYSGQESHLMMVSAIFIAWAASFVILILSPFLKKILGTRAITACERLMGLILTLIAVQMFMEGLTLVIHH